MLGFGVSLGRQEVFMSKLDFRSARLCDGELLPYIVLRLTLISTSSVLFEEKYMTQTRAWGGILTVGRARVLPASGSSRE